MLRLLIDGLLGHKSGAVLGNCRDFDDLLVSEVLEDAFRHKVGAIFGPVEDENDLDRVLKNIRSHMIAKNIRL